MGSSLNWGPFLGPKYTVDDRNSALRNLNYENYGIFLIMGNAGFISSTVAQHPPPLIKRDLERDPNLESYRYVLNP